jgi:ketosteroid isomerase-like protein
MSEENVDLWVEGIEAYNRGDIEAVLGRMDPDVKFEHRLAALQGKFAGVEAVRKWLLDAREHLEAGQIDCSDVRDLGDRVLALGTLRAIGKGSGAVVELPYTVLATIRDGRITHFIDFGDRAKALEAAGLSE